LWPKIKIERIEVYAMPKIVDEQMREAMRRRIIQRAAGEFARLGFDQANINVIAEQAGIGKGTIYLYFENKRELFLAMLRQIAQSQLSVIRAALASQAAIREQLEQLFYAFAQLARDDRDGFNVYMSALYGVNRAFRAEAVKLLRDYIDVITQVLEQAERRGEIVCPDMKATALLVLSLTESYVLSAGVLDYSEGEIERHAGLVVEAILHGIAPLK
jgi:AcrR family transcriptional regulator